MQSNRSPSIIDTSVTDLGFLVGRPSCRARAVGHQEGKRPLEAEVSTSSVQHRLNVFTPFLYSTNYYYIYTICPAQSGPDSVCHVLMKVSFVYRLTETQLKLDTLDKDPYTLDSLARPLPFRG